jgi:hypothetical protein
MPFRPTHLDIRKLSERFGKRHFRHQPRSGRRGSFCHLRGRWLTAQYPKTTHWAVRTGLSNDPRVASVDIEILGDVLPQLLEDGSTSSEVKPSKERVGDGLSNNLRRGAGDKLNYTGWDAGLLQQLVYHIVRVRRSGRRLPQYDVSNESRGTREVTADGSEVEG